jgi:protein-S-isoprenylcysteine O-methyltransferase Ste14
MELREHFVASGHWLFERRSWLPLIPLILVIIGLVGYQYPGGSRDLHRAWGVLCLLVGLFGEAIRVLTIGYVAKGTSGRNRSRQVAEVLNTRGIYSVVRHPLYLGNYFMWLGAALVPRDPWIVLAVTLVFWLYYERIMSAEEDFLRGKFGAAFEEWAARTPAFIPALGQWEREERPFSMRMIFRREHSGVYGLVAAICILAQSADMVAAGELRIDPFWAWILGVSTVLLVVVVGLKRYTAVFDVTDR